MPKSGHMANQHAKVAAAAIVAELSDWEINPSPVLTNTCYRALSMPRKSFTWQACINTSQQKKPLSQFQGLGVFPQGRLALRESMHGGGRIIFGLTLWVDLSQHLRKKRPWRLFLYLLLQLEKYTKFHKRNMEAYLYDTDLT